MSMRTFTAVALLSSICLASCETTYKQVATITPAEGSSSAVRFSKGNALIMSEGQAGTVWLLPVRYYTGDKIYFEVVAFNKTNEPVNFGAEDVQMKADDGTPMVVQDFDYLQHQARQRAEAELAVAVVAEGLNDWHAARVARRDPYAASIIYRQGANAYFASTQAINAQLEDAVLAYADQTLQTTTVDPFTTHGGVVYTQQIDVQPGSVRAVVANVRFAGEDHLFRLRIASEGTPAPVQAGLPAVTRERVEKVEHACPTWLWDRPGSGCQGQ
jgi:hypothetical protein